MACGRGRGAPRGRGVAYTFDTRNLIGDSRSVPDEESEPLPPTLFPPLERKLSVRSTPSAEEEAEIRRNWNKKARDRFAIQWNDSTKILDTKFVVNEAMFLQKQKNRPKDSREAKKSSFFNVKESEKAKSNESTSDKNDLEHPDYTSSYFDNGESYIDEDESKEDMMA